MLLKISHILLLALVVSQCSCARFRREDQDEEAGEPGADTEAPAPEPETPPADSEASATDPAEPGKEGEAPAAEKVSAGFGKRPYYIFCTRA
jgi:hypothetical protein